MFFFRDRQYVQTLYKLLGFKPRNVALYRLAFRHKSANRQENGGTKSNNERLEFLGDAILGAVIAAVLFNQYPLRSEGFLTEMRAKMVNRNFLNQLSQKMSLGMLIDVNEKLINPIQKKGSLYGDAFEALIGAIYLDRGFAFTKKFIVDTVIHKYVDLEALEKTEANYKSKLIEWCQRNGKDVFFEQIEHPSGQEEKMFHVRVVIENEEVGLGKASTKKNAEKIAAEKGCYKLDI